MLSLYEFVGIKIRDFISLLQLQGIIVCCISHVYFQIITVVMNDPDKQLYHRQNSSDWVCLRNFIGEIFKMMEKPDGLENSVRFLLEEVLPALNRILTEVNEVYPETPILDYHADVIGVRYTDLYP